MGEQKEFYVARLHIATDSLNFQGPGNENCGDVADQDSLDAMRVTFDDFVIDFRILLAAVADEQEWAVWKRLQELFDRINFMGAVIADRDAPPLQTMILQEQGATRNFVHLKKFVEKVVKVPWAG
tara:strand:+ start:8381 stop:8755 length:375 start_codon:yes stop_codon:yes gene_type:complete